VATGQASTNEQQDETAISPQGLCCVMPVTDDFYRPGRRVSRGEETGAGWCRSAGAGAGAGRAGGVSGRSRPLPKQSEGRFRCCMGEHRIRSASWWPCTCTCTRAQKGKGTEHRRWFAAWCSASPCSYRAAGGQAFEEPLLCVPHDLI
jgi:hypothetical protein